MCVEATFTTTKKYPTKIIIIIIKILINQQSTK